MYDVDSLKSAANGKWVDLFESEGIPRSILDGRHHPCPKCGGTDRFRLADADRGWIHCNQCFSKANSDGISAIGWIKNCNFKEACDIVGKFFNVKPNGKFKNPMDSVEVVGDIRPEFVAIFSMLNPGISALGLDRMGAVSVKHYGQHLIGFPAFGENLQSQIIWVLMGREFRHVKIVDKKKGTVEAVRKKTIGKGAALLGAKSIEHLRNDQSADVVWKVEGPTDLGALLSIIPEDEFGRHVAVSNVHGAKETPGWMADKLARAKSVYIVHDSDQAGDAGAEKWSIFCQQSGAKVKVIKLPEAGKDLRDFINENQETAWARLLELAESTRFEGQTTSSGNMILPKDQQTCLDALGIEVTAVTETGDTLIYSSGTGSTVQIKDLNRFSRVNAIEQFGLAAMVKIAEDPNSRSGNQYLMNEVRTAIACGRAIAMSSRSDIVGQGIWKSKEDEREILLCSGSGVYLWDGSNLTKLNRARAGGYSFRIERQKDWFDPDLLRKNLDLSADPVWCKEIWKRLIKMLGSWAWSSEHCPAMIAGLIGATWCQSVWKWRPMVAVTGKTSSGKTTLLHSLFSEEGHFGNNSIRTFVSSAAGLRQIVRDNSYYLALDEWDSLTQNRSGEILKLLRGSGPGDSVILGSASHKAHEFRMKMICWIAGVHCGLDSEMDENRFVRVELNRHENWIPPKISQWGDLRHPLMAIAVRYGSVASRVALEASKMVDCRGLHDRAGDNLAVPAAMIAASSGGTVQDAVEMAQTWANSIYYEVNETSTPYHLEMLDEILSATIDCGGGQKLPLADAINEPDFSDTEYERQVISQLGVCVTEHNGHKCLAIRTSQIIRALRLQMSPKALTQVLKRIDGASTSTKAFGQKLTRCVVIPWEIVQKFFESRNQISQF